MSVSLLTCYIDKSLFISQLTGGFTPISVVTSLVGFVAKRLFSRAKVDGETLLNI